MKLECTRQIFEKKTTQISNLMKIRAVGDDNDNHQYNHRKENLFTRFTNFKTKLN